jgi:hypothetical protein
MAHASIFTLAARSALVAAVAGMATLGCTSEVPYDAKLGNDDADMEDGMAYDCQAVAVGAQAQLIVTISYEDDVGTFGGGYGFKASNPAVIEGVTSGALCSTSGFEFDTHNSCFDGVQYGVIVRALSAGQGDIVGTDDGTETGLRIPVVAKPVTDVGLRALSRPDLGLAPLRLEGHTVRLHVDEQLVVRAEPKNGGDPLCSMDASLWEVSDAGVAVLTAWEVGGPASVPQLEGKIVSVVAVSAGSTTLNVTVAGTERSFELLIE